MSILCTQCLALAVGYTWPLLGNKHTLLGCYEITYFVNNIMCVWCQLHLPSEFFFLNLFLTQCSLCFKVKGN